MSEPQTKLDISDLKDTFLECPVCVEHFNQTDRRPRLLNTCLHAFCTQCLHQLLDNEGKSQITCPLCRQVQKVKGKADTLPLDPVRGNLVEYLQIKLQTNIPCTDCPDGEEADSRCQDCHIYLCISCNAAHKRNKTTRKHDIVTLEETLNEPVKSFLGHYCSEHSDHKIEFYCTQCNELCCLSCTVVKHKGHDLKAVPDAAREKLSDFELQMIQLNTNADRIRRKRASVLERTKEEKRKLVSSTAYLNKQFDRIFQFLDMRRSNLISELNTTSAEIIGSCQKQAQTAEDVLAVMDSANEYFNQMKSKSDDCELLTAATALAQTLKVLNSERNEDQSAMTISVEFPQRNIEHVSSLISSLGKIKTIPYTQGVVGKSTLAAAMIRDLGNATREELAHIERFVSDTRIDESTPDDSGQDNGEKVLHETDGKCYGSAHTGHHERNVSRDWGLRDDLHSPFVTSVASWSNIYPEIPSAAAAKDVTEYSFDLPGGVKVKVYYGNIVNAKTEGIVRTPNNMTPNNYADVPRSIESACGNTMRREHTGAGDLGGGTKYILHTVGPVCTEFDQRCGTLLTMTFLRCLHYARKKLRIQSIAFPFISTGVNGVPVDMCVESFLDAAIMFSNKHQSHQILREIHLVHTDLEMVQTAIVMIRQHLEEGLDALGAKAESRWQVKKSNTARNERFQRSEKMFVEGWTSPLTRDGVPGTSQEESVKWFAECTNTRRQLDGTTVDVEKTTKSQNPLSYPRSEKEGERSKTAEPLSRFRWENVGRFRGDCLDLQEDDILNIEVTDPTSQQKTPDQTLLGLSDSLDSLGDQMSVGSPSNSTAGMKRGGASKFGFLKNMFGVKNIVGKHINTKDNFRPRFATTSGGNSQSGADSLKTTRNDISTYPSSKNIK